MRTAAFCLCLGPVVRALTTGEAGRESLAAPEDCGVDHEATVQVSALEEPEECPGNCKRSRAYCTSRMAQMPLVGHLYRGCCDPACTAEHQKQLAVISKQVAEHGTLRHSAAPPRGSPEYGHYQHTTSTVDAA